MATVDQLQTQIAVVAGILGGVCLILLVALIIFGVMLNNLRQSLKKMTTAPLLAAAGNRSINQVDDDISSRFSQYPPVPQQLKVAHVPVPTHTMNPSPYQSASVGYDSQYGSHQQQPMIPRSQPYPSSEGQGRTNSAYVEDPRQSNKPRNVSGSYDGYGY